jgi:hypothetical protein
MDISTLYMDDLIGVGSAGSEVIRFLRRHICVRFVEKSWLEVFQCVKHGFEKSHNIILFIKFYGV